MLKLAFLNILHKKKYIKYLLYNIFLGIIIFVIFAIALFSRTYEKRIVGLNKGVNYATNISKEPIKPNDYKKYGFIEDVIVYKEYNTIYSNPKIIVNGNEYLLEGFYDCIGFDENSKMFSNNVYDEYGEIVVYGVYPNSTDEMLVTESFINKSGLNINDILDNYITIKFPNNYHISEEYRNKEFITRKIVGVVSDKVFKTEEIPSIFLYGNNLDMDKYFIGYINYVYYNTFENVESFHDILKEETGLDFYHNMNMNFHFLNILKKYVESFSLVIYVLLIFAFVAIFILIILNSIDLDKKNREFKFIINSYGLTRRDLIYESIIEQIIVGLSSIVIVIILTIIITIVGNNVLMDLIGFKIMIPDYIIISLPYCIITLILSFLLPLLLKFKLK